MSDAPRKVIRWKKDSTVTVNIGAEIVTRTLGITAVAVEDKVVFCFPTWVKPEFNMEQKKLLAQSLGGRLVILEVINTSKITGRYSEYDDYGRT